MIKYLSGYGKESYTSEHLCYLKLTLVHSFIILYHRPTSVSTHDMLRLKSLCINFYNMLKRYKKDFYIKNQTLQCIQSQLLQVYNRDELITMWLNYIGRLGVNSLINTCRKTLSVSFTDGWQESNVLKVMTDKGTSTAFIFLDNFAASSTFPHFP